MLNEKSDIYSFGVVLLESVTARDPVDYSKPADEVEVFSSLKNWCGQSLVFTPLVCFR